MSRECQIVRSLTQEHKNSMLSLQNILAQTDYKEGQILKRSHRYCLQQCLTTLQLIDTKLKSECDLILNELAANRVLSLPAHRQLAQQLLESHRIYLGKYTLNTSANELTIGGINSDQYDRYRGLACVSLDGVSINSQINPIMIQMGCSVWVMCGDHLKIKGCLPESQFRLKLVAEIDQMNLPGQLASQSINYYQDETEI
jgi:hypothetical protein